MSIRSFSEYWVIDHSDATKGIITRIGNPSAYGEEGEQILFSQHDAQWIEDSANGIGNILVCEGTKGHLFEYNTSNEIV